MQNGSLNQEAVLRKLCLYIMIDTLIINSSHFKKYH